VTSSEAALPTALPETSKREESGAHLGVIGGERERRSSAPDSLIVPV
jgi:hypothetical protein